MAFSILLVDDSPAMRTFIRRVLQLSGLEIERIVEAGDGVEALEALSLQSIDIIMTDLNMPRMNGEELMRKLAADPRHRLIPVVVVSTDSTDQRVRQLMSLGASGYVKKPFLPETLREELERVSGEASARAAFGNLDEMLAESSRQVLETMFFTTVLDESAPASGGEQVFRARLEFRGKPSGSLTVSLSTRAARSVTATFLGCDDSEVEDKRAGEVVCELTNMICGSLLSTLEAGGSFELAPPRLLIDKVEDGGRQPGSLVFQKTVALEEGELGLELELRP